MGHSSDLMTVLIMSNYLYFSSRNKFFFWHEIILTHDDFDIADPSSTQEACYTWTLYVAQLEVIGSIPVGVSDFFFVPCSRHVDQTISHKIIFLKNWIKTGKGWVKVTAEIRAAPENRLSSSDSLLLTPKTAQLRSQCSPFELFSF